MELEPIFKYTNPIKSSSSFSYHINSNAKNHHEGAENTDAVTDSAAWFKRKMLLGGKIFPQ